MQNGKDCSSPFHNRNICLWSQSNNTHFYVTFFINRYSHPFGFYWGHQCSWTKSIFTYVSFWLLIDGSLTTDFNTFGNNWVNKDSGWKWDFFRSAWAWALVVVSSNTIDCKCLLYYRIVSISVLVSFEVGIFCLPSSFAVDMGHHLPLFYLHGPQRDLTFKH